MFRIVCNNNVTYIVRRIFYLRFEQCNYNDLYFILKLFADNMLVFDFPSPPPSGNLVAALEELYALGAVGDSVNLTDPLGQRMAEMPLSPALAKMLLVSGAFIPRQLYEDKVIRTDCIHIQNTQTARG